MPINWRFFRVSLGFHHQIFKYFYGFSCIKVFSNDIFRFYITFSWNSLKKYIIVLPTSLARNLKYLVDLCMSNCQCVNYIMPHNFGKVPFYSGLGIMVLHDMFQILNSYVKEKCPSFPKTYTKKTFFMV